MGKKFWTTKKELAEPIEFFFFLLQQNVFLMKLKLSIKSSRFFLQCSYNK